jgi:hypothetical protein
MLRDSVVEFLQDEYRHGTLLVNPTEFCTLSFLENLSAFIAAQHGPRCPRCDAVTADYSRQIAHLQRWVRWLLPRRRGGRR